MNFIKSLINGILFLLMIAGVTLAVLYLASLAEAVNGS